MKNIVFVCITVLLSITSSIAQKKVPVLFFYDKKETVETFFVYRSEACFDSFETAYNAIVACRSNKHVIWVGARYYFMNTSYMDSVLLIPERWGYEVPAIFSIHIPKRREAGPFTRLAILCIQTSQEVRITREQLINEVKQVGFNLLKVKKYRQQIKRYERRYRRSFL